MEYKDYYKILGVDKKATADDIKKQYRRLARKYHPDVSKEANAEEKFKEAKEAYEVLKDEKKRKAYDQFGSNWKNGDQFQAPPNWDFKQQGGGAGAEHFDANGFSDFFESLFGQQRQQRGQSRHQFRQQGEDLHSKINITLEEAFHGTTRTLQLQEPEHNSQTGEVVFKNKSLKVKIPAGVVEGQQIRLGGQGSKGFGGGANGDLFLEIHYSDHAFFTVKNKDIYLNLPVTPWEAALGAKISIPTLGGKVEMSIPPGSQTGKNFRLKGRGLPGNPVGDEYVTLSVFIPEPKNEQQTKIYHNMAEEMPFNPRAHLLS